MTPISQLATFKLVLTILIILATAEASPDSISPFPVFMEAVLLPVMADKLISFSILASLPVASLTVKDDWESAILVDNGPVREFSETVWEACEKALAGLPSVKFKTISPK